MIDNAALHLESEATDHLHRIVQEGLTNALQHASARRIIILLEVLPTRVRIQILDDGCGIPSTAFENLGVGLDLGLKIMRYRAAVLGARSSVVRREGAARCSCVSFHRQRLVDNRSRPTLGRSAKLQKAPRWEQAAAHEPRPAMPCGGGDSAPAPAPGARGARGARESNVRCGRLIRWLQRSIDEAGGDER